MTDQPHIAASAETVAAAYAPGPLSDIWLDVCQADNDPFTPNELAAISHYCELMIGIPDCFDLLNENPLADDIPPEFTRDEVTAMFRPLFVILRTWRGHLAALYADLTEGHPLSGAATQYMQHEVAAWKRAEEGQRVQALDYCLGRDEHGLLLARFTRYYGSEYRDGQFTFIQPLA